MSDKSIGQMVIEIRADNAKFKKEIRRLNGQIKKDAQKGGKSWASGFGKGMQANMGKILASLYSLKKAFDFTMSAKNAARDAEEIQSKFNVVFGNLKDDANKWAQNFGNTVGRAVADVKQWMATLQDTFVPLGFERGMAKEFSQELTTLAVDVASFNNKMDDDVLRDFTSALVGNAETVRKYGIVITEANVKEEAWATGLAKSGEELSNKAKVQARMNLIIKGTTDAQGDALRTAKSLANVEKRLDAQYQDMLVTVGNELTPAFNKLTQAGIGLLKLWQQMSTVDQGKIWSSDDMKEYYNTVKDLSKEALEAEITANHRSVMDKQESLALANRSLSDASSEAERILIKEAQSQENANKVILGGLQEQGKVLDDLINKKGAYYKAPPENVVEETELLTDQLKEVQKLLRETSPTDSMFLVYIKQASDLQQKVKDLEAQIARATQKYETERNAIDVTGLTGEGFHTVAPSVQAEGESEMADFDAEVGQPMIEAGEKFGNDMFNAMSSGQTLASSLQAGLFKAGDSFVDHMGQAINIVSQILGIIAGFTPAGIAKDLGKGLVEGATQAIVTAGANSADGGSGASQSLINGGTSSNTDGLLMKIDSSVQAMNKNLVNKEMNTNVNVSMDGEKIAKNVVDPANNRMTRRGINLEHL